MNKLYIRIVLMGTVLVSGCGIVKTVSEEHGKVKFMSDEYRVNYGGCLNQVQMELNKVGDHLYVNNNGTLFFLTYDRSDESGSYVYPVFIQRFPNNCFDFIDVDTIVDFSQYDIGNFIDVESFENEGNNVYKDKYRYYHIVPMADGGHISKGKAHTYIPIGNGFYLGSDNDTYIQTQQLIKPPEDYSDLFYRKVPVTDPKFYTDLSGYYAKDSFNVYRDWGTTDGRNIAVIEEADVKTFSVIHYRLGKDKNYVFYNSKIVDGIDVNSLVILCNKPNADFLSSYGLIKDDKSVYYENIKIDSIDVESFECICEDSTIVFQDKNWIYDNDYFPNMDLKKRIKRN